MEQVELRKVLAANIKLKRKLYGLTQEKLAEVTELSPQTINDIEGCRSWVSDKSLIKIAEALHTTPAELLMSGDGSDLQKDIDISTLKRKLQIHLTEAVEMFFTNSQ